MQFNFQKNVFSKRILDPKTKYVFVADFFTDEYIGGAELTSEALITSAPGKIEKLKSSDLNADISLIESSRDKVWLFGNYTGLSQIVLRMILKSRVKYAICEYDYKFCRFRLPEKHAAETGAPCDCAGSPHGKLIEEFMLGAQHIFWMSQAQAEKNFSFLQSLRKTNNTVISSVFDPAFFKKIDELNSTTLEREKKNWIVLGSNSWVKGADAAKQYCEAHGLDHEVVWNLPYEELLKKLSKAVGLVYLPAGSDTCPRLVIEAKLLHCDLIINDNVQHAKEVWFSGDREQMIGYLKTASARFWKTVQSFSGPLKISGYTTTYNCVDQKYPFEASIKSMLSFCDEVCVIDGGSRDGTWDKLVMLAHPDAFLPGSPLSARQQIELIEDMRVLSSSPHESLLAPSKIKIQEIARDWTHKRHAVFDGQQKAIARKMCTGDFCWQQDSDEVVSEADGLKIRLIAQSFPREIDLLSLPVIEFWGGRDKVRIDVNPWKWRFSRNLPNITHGIPAGLRRHDENGDLFAAQGTDGCDYIDTVTGVPVSHGSFYTPEADGARRAALSGHAVALQSYSNWIATVAQNLPVVFHFSWWDLERKIRTYKNYWTKHWESLFDIKTPDTAENNFMFDKPWSEVTDDDIAAKAKELQKIGGFIWHKKWKGEITPWITFEGQVPQVM